MAKPMKTRRRAAPDGRRRDDRRRDGPDEAVKRRTDELVASGMPQQMASAVAQGRLDLNEALEKLARRSEVDRLMRDHELSRALATQVAMGHADLEAYLSKRRFERHRAENLQRSVLEEAAADGSVRQFGLFGQRRLEASVAEVTVYEATLQVEGAPPETLHKLAFKYAYRPSEWKSVKKGLRKDKGLSESPQEPAERPQDRYTCSDRRLFGFMDEEVLVEVTLLEGEVFRGTVAWFGRFEFALDVKGAEVVIFRHALRRIGRAS